MPAKHRPGWIGLLVVLSLAAFATGAERSWTSADGRSMRAEFVRELDGEVTFLKDGKLFTVPLSKLSPADQQIVRDLAAGKAAPADAPENPFEAAAAPASTGDAAATDAAGGGSEARTPIPSTTRTWTGIAGEQISAKFVRIFGSNVVLSRAGKTVTIGFYELSGEDQEHLKELLRSRGQESLIPEPPPVRETEGSGASTGASGGSSFAPPVSFGPSMGSSGFSGPSSAPSMSSSPFGPGHNFAEEARRRHEEFVERVRQQAEQRRQEREAQMAASVASAQPSASASFSHSSPGLDTPAPVPQFPSNRNEFSSDIVGECLSCKGRLTRLQAAGNVCPHCRVTWNFEQDEFGQRKPIASTASSPFGAAGGAAAMDPEAKARAIRIGIMVGVIVGVLALVSVVIFVAMVIASASSRKARRYT